ncbi:MAG: ABC transporter substrate-binding protein [Gemmatimonadota bacterium]|nr:ABC transporter substrate-binding protein [Gemmatimonadota bacterium]
MTETDVIGSAVTLQVTPERIISLIPSNTELLFAVGAGSSVVGVTNYCDYPPEAREIEKVGDVTTMSLEKIVALDPDLVLASKGNAKELVYSLKALDIPVFVLDPQSIEDVLDAIDTVGRLVGREEVARKLSDGYRKRLARVADRIGGLTESERPTIFVGSPFRDENWTPGPETFTSAVIQRAGGRNVADDLAPGTWAVYNLEHIVSRDPQVLLSTLGEGQDAEEVQARYLERAKSLKGWQGLDAVRNERVVLIPENWLLRPAPRLFLAIETLAAALHPNLF